MFAMPFYHKNLIHVFFTKHDTKTQNYYNKFIKFCNHMLDASTNFIKIF